MDGQKQIPVISFENNNNVNKHMPAYSEKMGVNVTKGKKREGEKKDLRVTASRCCDLWPVFMLNILCAQ